MTDDASPPRPAVGARCLVCGDTYNPLRRASTCRADFPHEWPPSDHASRQAEPPPEHGGPCIRSIDPDGKPLHYCAECYQDMPTSSGQTS